VLSRTDPRRWGRMAFHRGWRRSGTTDLESREMEKKTVLVAMSGGVDSSVAAALLVEQGHTVIGVTMKTFCYQEAEAELTGPTRSCCGLDGIMDARQVADRLGIAHYVFDVEREFTRDVIDDFVSEYAAGRTPNPCRRRNGHTQFRHPRPRRELQVSYAI